MPNRVTIVLRQAESCHCLSHIMINEIIIIMPEWQFFFYVAGYLIEERRRWPVITASPRGQCSK